MKITQKLFMHDIIVQMHTSIFSVLVRVSSEATQYFREN